MEYNKDEGLEFLKNITQDTFDWELKKFGGEINLSSD